MKIFLIGSGGREHALAWKLSQSPKCEALFCAPGNPGIAEFAETISIAVDDIDSLTDFAKENAIDLVVVGPEVPLVLGLVDELKRAGIRVFGPTKAAARLEGSKGFTKDLCAKNNIPTAAFGRFSDASKAEEFIRKTGAPIVIKADGLAAGKGVVIATEINEAIAAAQDMLSGHAFGNAGAEIVVEEFLDGEELSFFALSDGLTVKPFASAQDHKRVGDGDTGPNTGGMGAYSPAHLMDEELQQKIMDRIIMPSVLGMRKMGYPFTGVLFAGIMVVKGDPFLIEYNARFGDPETQVMMMRLSDDLVDVLDACASGTLSRLPPFKFSPQSALTIVMAAKGYPASYAKGGIIREIDTAEETDGVKVFHAGTAMNENGDIVSSGGRVLNVTAMAGNIKSAQKTAYAAVDKIDFKDGFCRRDIGWRAVKG